MQEQLDQALERIKVVEQERDAFKTAAETEAVARIAAEGRIPLPPADDPADEFASPRKTVVAADAAGKEARVSLSTMEIVSSAASEMEIEELTTQVLWERQRADRAQEMIEFLQAECQMHCCPCSKSTRGRTSLSPPQKRRRESSGSPEPREAEPRLLPPPAPTPPPAVEVPLAEPSRVKSKKEPRRSTIFCPREGIFRTVSEQEAEEMEAQARRDERRPGGGGGNEDDDDGQQQQQQQQHHHHHHHQQLDDGRRDEAAAATATETADDVTRDDDMDAGRSAHMDVEAAHPRMFARTPSVDPPAFALLSNDRTSLQSLLNAPHSGDFHADPPAGLASVPVVHDEGEGGKGEGDGPWAATRPRGRASPQPRPHTSASAYRVTTTRVPVRDDSVGSASSLSARLRTPSSGAGSDASFDHTNPALTPTMTREEALAKIRERRGRVRSAAQAAATPRKVSARGADRREVSAPTAKAVGRPRSGAR